MDQINTDVSRRRFLQATGATGALATAATVAGMPGPGMEATSAQAQTARTPNTVITKNICHQCPARCGIDVYTTDGRVHAIYGTTDHPISNGKLCPKGPLGIYVLYDPDRWKGPMKRTNPAKGRDEDPGFVPISWDEALDTVAARLNRLRAEGESHRFALLYGRGWGATGHLPHPRPHPSPRSHVIGRVAAMDMEGRPADRAEGRLTTGPKRPVTLGRRNPLERDAADRYGVSRYRIGCAACKRS